MTISSTEVYSSLYEYVSGTSMSVSYTNGSRDEHIFILYGSISNHDNPFTSLQEIVDEFEPNETIISSGSEGAHISLHFQSDALEGKPEGQTSYDRTKPRESNNSMVTECSNCRQRTNGLGRPPASLMFPSTNPYEKPNVETHDLCVTCSPGHFDDVTRKVEYFGVNESGDKISQVAYKDKDGELTWIPIGEMDNPYVQDTINVIEKQIL